MTIAMPLELKDLVPLIKARDIMTRFIPIPPATTQLLPQIPTSMFISMEEDMTHFGRLLSLWVSDMDMDMDGAVTDIITDGVTQITDIIILIGIGTHHGGIIPIILIILAVIATDIMVMVILIILTTILITIGITGHDAWLPPMKVAGTSEIMSIIRPGKDP